MLLDRQDVHARDIARDPKRPRVQILAGEVRRDHRGISLQADQLQVAARRCRHQIIGNHTSAARLADTHRCDSPTVLQ